MKTAPRTHLRDAVALALGASLIAGAFSATRAHAQAPGPAPAPTPSSPTPNNAPVTPPPTSTAPGAPASSTAPTPGAPRPFKDIVKDAKESKGFFTLWQKDDKVWIEVKPDQLDKPFLLALVNMGGLGEQRIYGGLMDDNGIAYFKKVGNQMQLILANERFRAPKGSPTERAIKTSFSESLVASGAVVSAPHPESKAVLVEANSMLLVDMAGAATNLENAFRIPYALDGRNSSLVKASTNDENTGFDVSLHFAVPKMPARPLVPNPAVPVVPPPQNVPDARSLFLGYRVNFAKLPEKPMAPRLADERVGYFTTTYVDFADDLKPNPNVHLVHRWRLEKKDPSAAVSEPVKPIVYWLDKNIPLKHRKAVIDGILEWNKAFERIGFKDAIQAKVQPDDADFDTSDTRYATVRWYLASGGAPAIGPSLADPRTGEIIDADILMTDIFTRSSRRFVSEDAPKSHAHEGMPGFLGSSQQFCTFAEQAHLEADFAMDILEARGDIAPDSPEAEKFVYDYVKEVITHEVGHTLGLRHNFRSSTIYTAAQIADPAFTAKNGVIGSVMDYPPFNIPAKGEKSANYVQPSLGPYDYWAIEYAYKPIDPASEKAELEAIAARGAKDPTLAYGTDEDSFIGGSPQGMDPTVNVWDLTDNPLGYYRKRLELSRELWERIQAKQLAPGESYDTLRRSFQAGFDQMNRGLLPVTKYVGGIVQLRDRAGSGRVPFTPVPAAQQREALKILNDGLFSVDSFTFKPEFLASLPHSRLDYYDALTRGDVNRQPMVSVPATILKLQREVLDQVMSDVVAVRLMESQNITKKGEAFKLSELYDNLQGSIWSELKTGREVTPMRRNLQREHLRRVAVAITRSSAGQPADARALQRMNAQQLAADLRGAQGKAGLSKETRAHYAESLNTIDEALKAPIQRAGA